MKARTSTWSRCVSAAGPSAWLASVLALCSACASDDAPPPETSGRRAGFEALSPEVLPAPPADPTNAHADDPDAALFGQRLFFEPRFSGQLLDGDNDGSASTLGVVGDTGKVSCAGCHLPESGFSDTRTLYQQISLAAGWGIRKAPSLLDVGQSKLLMWDGRRDSFFNQVFGVLESPVEGNSSRLYTAYQVHRLHAEEYESIFGPLPDFDDAERFPPLSAEETGCYRLGPDAICVDAVRGAPGDGAEYDSLSVEDQEAVTQVVVNLGKALGAYQRLLTCGPGRFDAWVSGDDTALTDAEKRGAELFVGKAGCVDCHSGPYLSDEKFHNVGLTPDVVAVAFVDEGDEGAHAGITAALDDELNTRGKFSDGSDGRLPETVTEEMLGAFRTPRLRCVGSRPSFMHTGQFRQLDEVVAFFNRGGDIFGYPGTNELHALDLSVEERADLVAFLHSLEGPGPDAELSSAP